MANSIVAFEDDADEELPEGGHFHPDFCDSLNGAGPHNYQPILDVFGGSGIWLWCTQCGDYHPIEGTAISIGATPTAAPAATPSGTGTPAPLPARNTFP